MTNVRIDFEKTIGGIKPMHAVNNGPIEVNEVEQSRGNSIDYRAAGIPYARTHDSTTCGRYGGPHAVDIIAIFPDFKNSPYDEDSYDFDLTDDYLNSIERVGTHVFFRFGATIEHERKKYGTKVPADFNKFAIVCEHIIRHYNEGWANGFHLGIEYWEIWNEPDGKTSDGDQPNWSGTAEEYYEMYSVTAKHLKKRFPALKIGGPAVSGMNRKWITDFFDYLTADGSRVPLDFFSWHGYMNDPYRIKINSEYVREVLDRYGYGETESILNEYNFILNWTDRFVESIKGIIGIRGAAFTAAAMSVGQANPVDMLMYYDARPCSFNGIFDFYTYAKLKGYYPFLYFSKLYKLGNCAESNSSDSDVFVTAASGGNGKAFMITYYQNDGIEPENRGIRVDTGIPGKWRVSLTDKDRDSDTFEVITEDGLLDFEFKPNTFVLVESI